MGAKGVGVEGCGRCVGCKCWVGRCGWSVRGCGGGMCKSRCVVAGVWGWVYSVVWVCGGDRVRLGVGVECMGVDGWVKCGACVREGHPVMSHRW